MVDVSLVIPAHNEQARLKRTLELYSECLQSCYENRYEILVVANACTDETVQVANEFAAASPLVKVVDIPEPVGKGGAVLEGFRRASGRWIAFADADGATSPESLVGTIERLKDADIVIGSRRLPSSRVIQKQPLLRRIFSRAFNFTVRFLFHLPYHDTQCGAKAFRAAAAKSLVPLIKERKWAFDVDLLLWAKACNYSVAEAPVVWKDQGGSKLSMSTTIREVVASLWNLKRENQIKRSYAENHSSYRPLEGAGLKKNLRILALNWRFIEHPEAGGSEVNIFEQARRWVHQGHQVTLFCADPGRKYAPQKDEVRDGIQVVRRGSRLTVYLFALAYYLMHARSFDYIVDVSNGIPFFTPLVARRPGLLLVHHVHGLQWFRELPYALGAFGWFLESRVVPALYARWPVVAVSPTTRDELIDLGFDPRKISIVYNGINGPDEAQASVDPPELREIRRITYIGRLKRYKRIDRLVRLMCEIREQLPDVHLDIAGEGDARPEIDTLIDKLKLRDSITMHGYIDEATKAQILSNATVFATPSMNEGWGLSVLEANAYGCPAVAFDVPGLRVSIRNGETGLLALDDASFKEAIVSILQDTGLRNRLSEGARKWAEQFDWDQSAEQTLEILEHGIEV